MTKKFIGIYKTKIMKRDDFIKQVIKSYTAQLTKLLPEQAYELEYLDLLNQMKEIIC